MNPIVTRHLAQHCLPLASVTASAEAVRHAAEGAALAASTERMTRDALIAFEADATGEEVAAVLEGQVDIVAAGEHYVLSAGEAILIPPREARRFRCLTPTAVLYRVTCNATGAGETESRS
jgi:quercetin dioxygenase-like cupin family protein